MMARVLSILGFGLVTLLAISVATNARAVFELNEIQTLSHLAQYQSEQDTHGHHHDDEDEPQSGLHSHHHRHAPEAPEHEHTHWDSGFFLSVATAPSPGTSVTAFAAPPISRTSRFLSHERAPVPAHLTPLFRPPIV